MVLKCVQNTDAATRQRSAEARNLDGRWEVKFTSRLRGSGRGHPRELSDKRPKLYVKARL